MQSASFPTASLGPGIRPGTLPALPSGVPSGVPSGRTVPSSGFGADLGNFLAVLRREAGTLEPDAALSSRTDPIQPPRGGDASRQAPKPANANAANQSSVSSSTSSPPTPRRLEAGARRDDLAEGNSAPNNSAQDKSVPSPATHMPQGDPGLIDPGLIVSGIAQQSQTLPGNGRSLTFVSTGTLISVSVQNLTPLSSGSLIPASSGTSINDASTSALALSRPPVQPRANSKENSPKADLKTGPDGPLTPLPVGAPAESIPLFLSFSFGLSVSNLAANSLSVKTPSTGAALQGQSDSVQPSVQSHPGDGRSSPQSTPPAERRSAVETEPHLAGKLSFRATLVPLDGFEDSDAPSNSTTDVGTGGVLRPGQTPVAGLSPWPVAGDVDERPSELQSTNSSNPGTNSEQLAAQPGYGNVGAREPSNSSESQPADPDLKASDFSDTNLSDINRQPVTVQNINPLPEQVASVPLIATPGGSISPARVQPTEDPRGTAKLEPKSETNLPNQVQPAREISVKLSRAEMPNVDIRLSDRGGRILVSVRSESPELAASLRSDLGDLVGRLESRGYQAEMAVPLERIASGHFAGLGQPGHSGQSDAGQSDAGQSDAGQSDAGHRQAGPEDDTPGNPSQQQNQQEPRRGSQPFPDPPIFSLDEVQFNDRQSNQQYS